MAEDFPPLDAKPPYHPNCRCTLLPITHQALQDRGEFDAVLALSNSTPKFILAADANEWLEKNESHRITTHAEYRRFLKTGDRRTGNG